MDTKLKAQVRTSLDRSSKVIKDHERIEAVVEVPGAGRLVLCVDGGGVYSLRGYAEGNQASSPKLLAFGVIRSDEIVSVYPEGVSAAELD